jgi:PadR family transcriptional regulator PadR
VSASAVVQPASIQDGALQDWTRLKDAMMNARCIWHSNGTSVCFARMPNRETEKAGVLQGTLDLMVLQTLSALGPMHGYAIAARVEQSSRGSLQLNMGTLYPGLMRLEQRRFIKGTWGVTDTNRRARFYAITAAGRRQLAAEKSEWARTVAIMQTLLDHKP